MGIAESRDYESSPFYSQLLAADARAEQAEAERDEWHALADKDAYRARIAEEDADRLAARIRNHLLTLAWSKMRPIDHDEVESALAAHDEALKARGTDG